ncbi:MAG: sucrase ferredoxin, partial [Nostoc sp.]
FGGHRFAPTVIDLPEGRYYGVLDQDSFKSILNRTGEIQCLNKVYRGWGILPAALQILERELILRNGWDWFNYKVAGKILEQSLDNNTILAELSFEQPSGSLYT